MKIRNFKKLLREFRKLKISNKKYVIFGGGVLAIRRIRDANDLDVLVTKDLYKKLKKIFLKMLKMIK